MIQKLLAIAWKDMYVAFQDRNAMLMMFAAPLGLSLIIGLAFGSGGDVSIDAVPVAVVAADEGATLASGEAINLGETYRAAFVPDGETDADYAVIHELTDGVSRDDLAAARDEVEDGDLAAVIYIPAGFSADIFGEAGSSAVDIYYDSALSIGPSVVTSIVRAITNGINAVILAQQVGPVALADLGADLDQDPATIAAAAGQMSAEAMAVARQQPVQLEQVDLQGETRSFDMLQYFAPAMAILFMTFAMAAGGTSILEEQRDWTLQRIISSPTPRWVFMAGKLTGTFATGLVQMIVLILTTSLVARMMGRSSSVWGDNYAGIALLVVGVVLAGTSLGLFIAAVSRTPEQAATYSSLALWLLGMLGGSFIPLENLPAALDWLPKITLNYWGIQGFFALSYDEAALADILPNLGALVVFGALFFVVSVWRFNRRLDI